MNSAKSGENRNWFLILLSVVTIVAFVNAVCTCSTCSSIGCPSSCASCSSYSRSCSCTSSCTYSNCNYGYSNTANSGCYSTAYSTCYGVRSYTYYSCRYTTCYGSYSYTYCCSYGRGLTCSWRRGCRWYYYCRYYCRRYVYYSYWCRRCGYYTGYTGYYYACNPRTVLSGYRKTCARTSVCGTGTCTSCTAGRYGSSCQYSCSCNGNTCSTGINGNGACSCSTGYAGSNCQYTVANSCNGRGSISTSGSGYVCSCPGNWAQPNCATCAANWYPAGSCTTYCVPSTTCSGRGSCAPPPLGNGPGDGSCTCNTGWLKGSSAPYCTTCAANYYPAGSCVRYCSSSSTCSNHGYCTSQGYCSCNTGWAYGPVNGRYCSSCASGYYGSSCTACPGGGSTPCSGRGTCSDGLSGSGVCSCQSGYAGQACQYSDAGTCSGHGTAQYSGSCVCSPPSNPYYAGASCNACSSNRYNYPTCRYCLASSTCSGHGSCTATGYCSCNIGFKDDACDSCATGYFDYPSCVACSVSVTCSNRGTCQSDGSCVCNSGVTTAATTSGRRYCDACLPGYFAALASPSCARCPGPQTGSVQPCWGLGTCSEGIGGTGACTCTTGYSGAACVDPVVTSLSPRSNIPTAGGTVLFLGGYFLECDNTKHASCSSRVSSITVGGVACTITSRSASSIQCTTPPSQPASGYVANVVLTRGDGLQAAAGSITFSSPAVTGMSPSSGPVDGNTPYITISGVNFGASAGTVVFSSIGTQTGANIVSWGHTQIVVKKPVGMGSSSVSVSNAGASSNSRTYIYNEASISTWNAGPFSTQAGSTLSITGVNFGYPSTLGSSVAVSATIGGRVATVTSRTDGVIVLSTPAGVGTQALVLTVGGTSLSRSVSYLAPAITGIRPGSGACTLMVVDGRNTVINCNPSGGDSITVEGTNFGPDAAKQNSAEALTIKIKDDLCTITSMPVAHSEVVCTTPVGFGKLRVVSVARGTTQMASNSNGLFSYRGPVIGKGTLKFAASLQSSVNLQSKAAVALQVDAKHINLADTFTTARVEFNGEQFCPVEGCDLAQLSVTYGPRESPLKYPCAVASLVDYTDTMIRCTTGPGVGRDLRFTVKLTSAGQSDPGEDSISYPEPSITNGTLQIVGASVPLDGVVLSSTTLGDLVSFEGTHYGTTRADVRVTYGQQAPWEAETCQVESVTDTKVECRTVPGTGTGWRFKVWVGAGSSNQTAVGLADQYNYKAAPRVDSVQTNGGCEDAANATSNCPTDGVTAAGQRVRLTIRGANFGGDPTMQILIGENSCNNMVVNTNLPDAEVTCDLPAGIGTPSMVLSRLEGGAVYSSPYTLITYAAPVITSVSGCEDVGSNTENCDRLGGQRLTVRGTNFGIVPNNPPQILLGGQLCQNPVQTTDESVICDSVSGTFVNLAVILIQYGAGFRSNSDRTISFRPCAPGTVALTNELVCRNCTAGKYAGIAGLESCLDCDSGRYSDVGAVSCTKCSLGMYSPNRGRGDCLSCPAGSYADTEGAITCILTVPGFYTAPGASEPVACAAGYYASGANSSGCVPCEAGKAGAFTGQSSCPECPTGKYNEFMGQTECTNCRVGRYANAAGMTGCLECPIGYFADLAGVRTCSMCPRGRYQDQTGRTLCVDCKTGRFQSDMGSTDCDVCPAGRYSAALGRAQPCNNCPAGSYQPDVEQLACITCPVGKYQELVGSIGCKSCPVGKYQDTGGKLDCFDCPPGTYTNLTTQTGCVACPAGKVSEFGLGTGASACVDCATGRYALATGLAECLGCSPGKFAGVTGSVDCQVCPLGKFNDDVASDSCESCPVGRFGPTVNLLQCQACMMGRYQNGTGRTSCDACPDGKFQSQTGASNCRDCDPGFYSFSSNSGNAVCSGCPSGYFQNLGGSTSCTACSPGKYSTFNFVSGTAACRDCAVGTYAAGFGTSRCVSCPGGLYSNATGASVCQTCALGKFQDRPGSSACTNCAPGKYASTTGQLGCFDCNQGFYQILFGTSSCDSCQVGKFTDQKGQQTCQDCPPGYKNPFNGSALCFACPPGQYNSAPAQTACTECAVGYYQDGEAATTQKICPAGQISNVVGSASCTPCSSGTYASTPGQTMCAECATGKFAGVRGSQDCISCSLGKYIGLVGQVECRSCAAGKFTSAEGSTICTDCGVGRYAEVEGATACIICDPGKVTSSIGQAACTVCPAGKYTLDKTDSANVEANCQSCEQGSYAAQAGSPTCLYCPAGKFSAVTAQETCTLCPAGRYQTEEQATTCVDCPSGKYQQSTGQTECRFCLTGRSSNATGQTEYGCPACVAGKYADEEGLTACLDCTPGSYQNANSSLVCKSCDPGTYSTATALDTNCPSCPAGKFSNLSAATFCYSCEVGYYQTYSGQFACEACPAGWYQDGTASSGCLQCAVGYYNDVNASTSCTRCEPGRAQELGSLRTSCLDCQPGFFSEGGLEVCLACAAGTVTNATRSTSCLQCDANSDANSRQTECLCYAGYFTYGQEPLLGTNATTIDCIPCPNGADCLEKGTTYENMKTLPGWWRQDENSLIFTKCTVPEQCQGGRLSSCGPNRGGPGCTICLGNSRSITAVSSCDECPDKQVSLFATIIILSITLIFLLVTFALVLRADASLHEAAKFHDTMRLQHDSKAHATRKLRAHQAASAVEREDMIHEDMRHQQTKSEEQFEHALKDWLADDKAIAPPVVTDEQRRWGPNVTVKIKLLIGWIQILSNLTYWLDVSWPTYYRYIISYLAVFNMDLVPWQTLECAVDNITFYTKFFTMTLTPVGFFVVIFCFYALPRLIAARFQQHAHGRHKAKKYSMRQYYRMIIFLGYLVYPGVSARVMSYFLWKDINGVKYLRADFRQEYESDEWYKYLYYALGCIVAYPFGIPFFFFVLLCRNRKRLLWPATRIRLGMLYAAYHDKRWWFEMLDLTNKLVLSAAIVFVPAEFSIRVAMLWAGIYMILTLVLNPFIRKGDDRLSMLCQAETFLIMMSAQLLTEFNSNAFNFAADNTLTMFDLVFSGLVVWFFLIQAGKNLKKIIVQSRATKESRSEIAESEMAESEMAESEQGYSGDEADMIDEVRAVEEEDAEADNDVDVQNTDDTTGTPTHEASTRETGTYDSDDEI